MNDLMLVLADSFFESHEFEQLVEVAVSLWIFLFFHFMINIPAAVLLSMCYSAVPREHRTLEPGLCFLLLIPIFDLVWNFIVFLGLSNTYRAHFQATGRTRPGDYGRTLGLWYSIAAVFSVVPCIACLAFPTSLVLLILSLVKAFEMRGVILRGT